MTPFSKTPTGSPGNGGFSTFRWYPPAVDPQFWPRTPFLTPPLDPKTPQNAKTLRKNKTLYFIFTIFAAQKDPQKQRHTQKPVGYPSSGKVTQKSGYINVHKKGVPKNWKIQKSVIFPIISHLKYVKNDPFSTRNREPLVPGMMGSPPNILWHEILPLTPTDN